jgi:DNA-binding CsgD family transcriptional regulator
MNISDLSMFTEHPSYLLGDKIAEICAPLFCNFSINYFCYTKWQGNKGMFLSSNKNWLRYYLQSDYKFLVSGKKIHSWSANMPPKALAEAVLMFDYHNGIMVEKASLSGYIETLEFASPNKYSDPLEFCCNKDLLNQFFLYFKDKANNLIKVIEKDPICFSKGRFFKIEEIDYQFPASHYSGFYKSIDQKKIRFKFKEKEILFSRREFDVLCLLVKGKTMTEAAEILQISRRTVETYIYDAKNKTGAFTVNQLLDNFVDTLF